MSFAWSRTWYAEYQGQIYNFEKKSQRDECVNKYGFRLVTAKEAYQYFDIPKVFWRDYDRFIQRTVENKKLIDALRVQNLQSIEYYMKKYKVTYEEVKEAYNIALKLNLKEQQQ